MAIDTIKSTAVLDGAIATVDIADDAVTSAKLDTNISVDGNLGLGTSVSTRKLNVNAGSYGHMLLDTANAAHGIQILGQANAAANSGFDIQYAASTGMKIRTLAVQPLSLQTSASAGNPSNNLHIHTNGVVSIPNGIELGSGVDATAANTLDDYEEGTWTANLIGSTSNPSTAVTSTAATYTKIGRLVYARWMIGPADVAGASGAPRINGLPFNNAGGHVSGNVMMYYRKTGNADAINVTPYISGNIVYFFCTRDGYSDVWAEILFNLTGGSNNFYLYASIVYETAS